MKKILLALIVAVLSVSFVGCGNNSSNSNNSSEPSQSESSSKTDNSSSQSNQSETKEYKVGDTISFEGEEITLTNVQRNYNTGNEYSKPASGKEFVKVTVTIKNVSNSNISLSPFDFKIQDSNGSQESLAGESYSLDDQLNSAELIPQGTKTGSMIFEVPKDDAGLKLIYKPNAFNDKQIAINL